MGSAAVALSPNVWQLQFEGQPDSADEGNVNAVPPVAKRTIPVSVLLAGVILGVGCSQSTSRTAHTELERKAASGDPAAAWRLHGYHAFESGDERAADTWMRRAAELQHPQAQRLLAYLIKDRDYSPKGFGTDAPSAVKILLEQSARTEGNACNDLASAYAEGYFADPDQSKARTYFERGARFNSRTCWQRLSHYYRHGLGGPRDDAAAYYWISLEARCVDPRSVNGQATWTAREEIAAQLSLAALEREWKRLDAFVAQVEAKKVIVDSPPFLNGMIPPEREAEGTPYFKGTRR